MNNITKNANLRPYLKRISWFFDETNEVKVSWKHWPVRNLSKHNIPNQTSDIEKGRGGGWPPLQVTHQVQLRDQGGHKLWCVILPPVLTRDHGPVSVGMFGPHPAIFLQILQFRNFNLHLIRGEWASGLPGAGRANWRCTWSTWSRACSRRPPARGASQDELSGSSWGQERHPPAGAGDTSAWAQPRGKPEPETGFRQNVKHR